MPVVLEDRVANGNAFVTNVCSGIVAGGRNKLAYDILTLVTE
jgi:hypothetical protein